MPSPDRRGGRRRFLARLLLIAIAGWICRGLAAWEMATANGGINAVFFPSVQSDPATYLRLAAGIVNGSWPEVFYYQPFYYAVFLPLIRLCCGGSMWAVIFWQTLCGAGAIWFAGLCGAMAWSRRAGLLTAAAVAVAQPLLLYCPFAQNETLQSLLLVMTAYFLLKMLRHYRWRDCCAAGAVLGMAVLTRGNVVLFLLPVWAVMIVSRRRELRRTMAGLLLLTGTMLLVESPFIGYNSWRLGRFSGPSTAADAVLALGNTPEAPPGGRDPGLPAGPMEYPETYSDFMDRASERPVPLQMLDWLCREPGAFLELQFRKALLFWDSREIPNNVSLTEQQQVSRMLRWDWLGRSAVLLPLSLAGLLWCFRKMLKGRRALLLLALLVVVYWGGTAIFYNLSRFRAPVLPLALIFAGIWCDRSIRVWRRHGFRAFEVQGLPPLLAGLFICIPAYDLYREYGEAAVQRWVRPDGICYTKRDGTRVRLDHGPLTFGGWQPVLLTGGMVVEKTFAGPSVDGEWVLTVFNTGSSDRVFSGTVNGGAFQAVCPPGISTVTRPVAAADRLVFRIAHAADGIALLTDSQRQYGRTRINGGPAGELVVRFRSK